LINEKYRQGGMTEEIRLGGRKVRTIARQVGRVEKTVRQVGKNGGKDRKIGTEDMKE
jgi:hypothetical protein